MGARLVAEAALRSASDGSQQAAGRPLQQISLMGVAP